MIDEPILCKIAPHTWRWTAPIAEIITTAAYTAFGLVSMPKALLDRKEAP